MTFIADERFQAHYKEESKQWILQIKYVQPRDIGLYECQVSTEPKISARAYLHVVGKFFTILTIYSQMTHPCVLSVSVCVCP